MTVELLNLALLVMLLIEAIDLSRQLRVIERLFLGGQSKEEERKLRHDERRVRKLDGKLHR